MESPFKLFEPAQEVLQDPGRVRMRIGAAVLASLAPTFVDEDDIEDEERIDALVNVSLRITNKFLERIEND
jgi:hypothetical protein